MINRKRLVLLGMAAIMAMNISPSICYASEASTTAIEESVEPKMLIDTLQVSASECKNIYEEMNGYTSWSATIAGTVVGFMGAAGTVVGGVTAVATIIQQINYNMAKKAFKEGWQSGKGCRILIYDNAVPTVLVNS